MSDIHYLGAFSTLNEVYKKHPTGGVVGDYINLSGIIVYWNDNGRKWGDFDPINTDGKDTQETKGNLVVNGNLDVSGKTTGNDAEYKRLSVDHIKIKDDPFASFDHNHDTAYSKSDHFHYASEIKGLVAYLNKLIDQGNSSSDLMPFIDQLMADMVNKLSKKDNDTAQGLINFLKGAEFGRKQNGAASAQITPEGRISGRSLELTESLTVPELIYNRAEVILGVQWGAPGGGKIKSVDAQNQIVELKLEEGEIGGVKVDDICMGIWHFQNRDWNASVDEDDSRMNFRFAGFATIYFRVTEVLDGNNSRFRYALRAVDEDYTRQYHPQAMMSFVGYGNFTDKNRQQSRYDTREYKRYLQGVNTWTITAANIAAQYGDLANLKVHGLEMTGYSAYLNNVYFSGVIQEIEAAPLRMEISFSLDGFMAPGERGVISVAIKKAFDDVTYLMRSWTWKRDTGDAADDAVWNMAHRDATDSLEIGYEDLGSNSMLNVSTLFTITASDLAGKSVTGQLTI